MKEIIASVVVTLYYIFSYSRSIPVIYKAIKTKKTDDYSLTSITIAYLAGIAWCIYIFLTKQTCIVYVGTVIDWILLTAEDISILLYRTKQCKK